MGKPEKQETGSAFIWECLRTCWRLGTFRGVWGRVEGVMIRFGVRGRRLGGVLGASWGLLGGSWVPLGATFGAQKARWTPFGSAQNHAFYEVFWRFCIFLQQRMQLLKRWGGDLESLESLLGASWVLLVTVLVPQKASWGRTGAS